MNRRIAGVVAGVAMFAGLASVSTAVVGVAVADGGQSGQLGAGREWSSEDSSIFTVNYGYPAGSGHEFGGEVFVRDQAVRDQ